MQHIYCRTAFQLCLCQFQFNKMPLCQWADLELDDLYLPNITPSNIIAVQFCFILGLVSR